MNEKSCCSSGGCCDEFTMKTVSTTLAWGDYLGAWKVRWGIDRMDYTVEPGLYAVGKLSTPVKKCKKVPIKKCRKAPKIKPITRQVRNGN